MSNTTGKVYPRRHYRVLLISSRMRKDYPESYQELSNTCTL